jgi:hypothetical protein
MIQVLRPLTSKKNASEKLYSKSITPSEANLKLHALEQDLTLMKDELTELEAKYGKIESEPIPAIEEAIPQEEPQEDQEVFEEEKKEVA